MPFKSLDQLINDFDPELLKKLFGEKDEASLKILLGPNFELWLDMFNRLFTVVQLLPRLLDRNLGSDAHSDCIMLLTSFLSMPPKWSVHSFARIVEQVDPKITQMIFEMIEQIIANPSLKSCIRHLKKNQYDHPPPPPGAIQNFVSYTVYDSLPEMLMQWKQLHAVPKLILSNPAAVQKLPFCCSFQVAHADARATPQIRKKLLCISGHYNFAVKQLFSNSGKPRISRQMEQVLRKYFGDEIFKKLL